jgi:hypothetical protein
MDVTKPKGEVVGSITLHVNSQLRISHVEIKDRGDLVAKRTVQDSMMLIFRAIGQHRAKRKASGRVAEAEEIRQAEERDNSRLERYKQQKAAEREQAERELQERIESRIKEAQIAEEKAKMRLVPGHSPKVALSLEEKRQAAIAAANKQAEELAAKNAEKHQKKEKTEPVTAAKSKEK